MWNRHLLCHVFIPIIIGGLIYTLLRVNTLLVFRVYEVLQLDGFIKDLRQVTMQWEIPDFVKFSLPDGLWVYAFTYFIVSLWKHDESNGKEKYIFMLLPLLFGIGGELIQIFNNRIGTFDLQDVFISLIAYLVGYIAVHNPKIMKQGEVKYG